MFIGFPFRIINYSINSMLLKEFFTLLASRVNECDDDAGESERGRDRRSEVKGKGMK